MRIQQRLGGHDHAVEAVAALRGLFPDEGVLHRIGMIARAKTFERENVALDAAADRDHAGARGDAVDQHGAGPAFAEPAAEFRPVQFEIVAQHIKQRGIGSGVDVMDPAVDCQADRACVMLLVPLRCCVANTALNPCEDTVCIQTCKLGIPPPKPLARFMNSRGRQLSFYSAAAFFGSRRRLTGFRGARKIVRIQTKCPDRVDVN